MPAPPPFCPACGSSSGKVIGRRTELSIPELLAGAPPASELDVMCCRRCHHYWAHPVPTAAELANLYSDASAYFPGTPGQRLRAARNAFLRLASHFPAGPHQLLDVGSGDGALLAAATDAGWGAVGIEPTAKFAATARSRGLDVHVGYLDDDFRPITPFDAVSAMAVLEHVPSPKEFLDQCRRVIKAGGLLFLEVPNGRRLDAAALDLLLRLRGRPWTVRTAPLHEPFHLSEFSKRSLEAVLRQAGFEVVSLISKQGVVPYPVPPAARRFVRLLEHAGARAGFGLNLVAVARAVAAHR